nr:T9SS type A sorting domain-containing protein [Catalimonadaceae bacterium]
LDVCGDITGGGSVTGSGTIVLNGTAAQGVSGTVGFQNVTITKPASSGNVTVNGTARIKGILTLANSNSNLIVSPGANLILVSDASGTASIATIPSGASVIGNVTQQRYIPGTGDGWFFIGTSVQGGDFSQWSDNILMYAGTNLGGNQGVTALGIQHSTIFTYNDAFHHITSDTAQKRGWRVPVLGDLINPGQGFRVWLNSDNCPTRTYDNVGSITQGNFNFPTLNRTEPTNCQPNISPNTVACDESFRGWNFLANPYPSAINWDAAGWTKPATMANSFYRWNSAGSGYGVYNGGGSYLGAGPAPLNPNLIPSGQGFFVKLEDPGVYTGTLSITENVKVGNSASFLRTSSSDNTLNILLENPALNGTYNYTGEIRFSESATDGRDKQVDVANLPCGRFHFGMAVSGQELVLNTMGPLNNVKIVPMNTHFMGSNGTYRFVLSGIESFTAGTTIFIRDNYLGTVQDIVANPIYSFVVDTENQGMVNRFELVFSPDGVSGVKTGIAGKVISLYPNPASGKQINLVIKGEIQGEGSVLMTDVLGKVVYRSAIAIESGSSMKVLDTDLAAGIYTVKVQTASGVFTEKLIVR